jgi:hypothetical protein
MIAASPTAGFYSQIAALFVALRSLDWDGWIFTVHVHLGGPVQPELHAAWLPFLPEADVSWSSAHRFGVDGEWAQSDDIFRCAPRDADLLLMLDADTFPVRPLTGLLNGVLERDAVAGVVAHYPFPRFPGASVREAWQHAAHGIVARPLEFCCTHTLVPPDAPADLQLSPFYVNGGVVCIPRGVFGRVATEYLAIRPQLMTRMPNPDFAGQVALTLAVTNCGANIATLPVRYNFPNDRVGSEEL